MNKARAENICRNIGRIRRKKCLIKGGRDSNFLSTKTYPNKNQQDQPAKDDSKEDSLGKRGRPSIQCWGCKEDHLYKDFPHRKDKMKTMHNIQEATTIEDMGRIYATLED
jgi:hypothetical protein